jgi:hypothetical protein
MLRESHGRAVRKYRQSPCGLRDPTPCMQSSARDSTWRDPAGFQSSPSVQHSPRSRVRTTTCVRVRACASGSMVNTNALLRITLLACYLCGIGQCKMFRNASCHAFDNQGMRRDLGSIG